MLNHFVGFASCAARAAYIRAKVGVNSGRRAKGARPSFCTRSTSSGLFPLNAWKSSPRIPSPLFTAYSSLVSKVGPSISSNPCRIEVSRHTPVRYRRRSISSGYRSRVPFGF